MKKFFALFVFFIGINSLVFSQEKNSLQNLTSGKWKIESIEIQNEIINISQEESWMVFNVDGVYEIFLDNEALTGTWKLNGENDLKFDLEDYSGESGITELTSKQLEFSISEFNLVLIKPQINDEPVIDSLTSGKWKINTVSIEDEVMDVTGEGNWMAFNSNGTYEIMLDDEEQLGTWNLDAENHISLDSTESYISTLNKDHLSFSISGYNLDLSK